MVVLGRANSRMKDLYDIWILSRSHEFTSDSLARAIAATFARRKTAIPTELPDALTHAFAEDPQKTSAMEFLSRRMSRFSPGSLAEVIDDLTHISHAPSGGCAHARSRREMTSFQAAAVCISASFWNSVRMSR